MDTELRYFSITGSLKFTKNTIFTAASKASQAGNDFKAIATAIYPVALNSNLRSSSCNIQCLTAHAAHTTHSNPLISLNCRSHPSSAQRRTVSRSPLANLQRWCLSCWDGFSAKCPGISIGKGVKIDVVQKPSLAINAHLAIAQT